MLDPLVTVIVGFLATFFAAVSAGLSGLGFALVSVSLMILVLPPKIVVPIVLINGILLNLIGTIEARKWMQLRRFWPLIVAGVVTMPLGTYMLIALEVTTLKVFIGAVIAVFAIAFLVGFRREIKNEKIAFIPVGVVGGLLAGSTQMMGPPVALIFTNQAVSKPAYRAGLYIYILVLSLTSLPTYIFGGLITEVVIRYAAYFFPAMILGVITGIKLVPRVNQKLFRTITLLVVLVAGVLSIGSGLGLW